MRKKIAVFTFILALIFFNINAQTVSGSLRNYLNIYLTSIAGSSGDDYLQANSTELNTWNLTVEEILNQNIASAQTYASTINYKITEYIDTVDIPDQLYYILEEQNPKTKYWGIFIFNSSPCRNNLVIQAPHPIYDINTGEQAIYCFSKLNAKSLFIAGAHRCNHSSFSSCDGTTTACSSSLTAYRISDMAHNVNTPFQNTTEILMANDSSTVFFQLHGFAKESTDPYLIISNGTRDTPLVDYAVQFKNELSVIDNTLTFKIAHIDLSWDRLIAFSNTQGRLVNGSLDPCNTHNNYSNGNFVHLEQEKTKLRLDSTGWEKIFLALSNTFICIPEGIHSENIIDNQIIVYPNPTSSNNITIEIKENYITNIQVLDIMGRILIDKYYNNSNKVKLDLTDLKQGVYMLIVNNNSKSHKQKIIIK